MIKGKIIIYKCQTKFVLLKLLIIAKKSNLENKLLLGNIAFLKIIQLYSKIFWLNVKYIQLLVFKIKMLIWENN